MLAERHPARVLEIAPGPARLTAELAFSGRGVAVDASPQMLAVARDRLRGRPGEWLIARGDAFALPLADRAVDLVYTTKFVRHFQRDDRARLYAQIRRVLRPGGAFVMDAQNRAVSLPHRQRRGLERYPIYDVLYELPELIDELESEQFRVARVEGLVQALRPPVAPEPAAAPALERVGGGVGARARAAAGSRAVDVDGVERGTYMSDRAAATPVPSGPLAVRLGGRRRAAGERR